MELLWQLFWAPWNSVNRRLKSPWRIILPNLQSFWSPKTIFRLWTTLIILAYNRSRRRNWRVKAVSSALSSLFKIACQSAGNRNFQGPKFQNISRRLYSRTVILSPCLDFKDPAYSAAGFLVDFQVQSTPVIADTLRTAIVWSVLQKQMINQTNWNHFLSL